MRNFLIVFLFALIGGCENVGGGDTVVHGDGNLITDDSSLDRLAHELAGFEATPRVTDEDLQAIYETIRTGAVRGDLESALVLLKLAASQRDEQ